MVSFSNLHSYRSLPKLSTLLLVLSFATCSAHADNSIVHSSSLLRISFPVELIPEAFADDSAVSQAVTASTEELNEQENKLQKMEEDLLKSLSKADPSNTTGAKSVVVTKTVVSESKRIPQNDAELDAALASSSSTSTVLNELKDHPAFQRGNTKKVVARSAVVPQVKSVRQLTEITTDGSVASDDGETSGRVQKLAIAESQVKILSRELDISRRSLVSAEQQIEELKSLVKRSPEHTVQVALDASAQSPRGSLRAGPTEKQGGAMPEQDDFRVNTPRNNFVPLLTNDDSSTDQIPGTRRGSDVATVVLDRAPLRVGPGKFESAMYSLPRSTQLAVERRNGEWYRVTTDSGVRGWVYGSALRFDSLNPASSIRVGGVRAGYEKIALK